MIKNEKEKKILIQNRYDLWFLSLNYSFNFKMLVLVLSIFLPNVSVDFFSNVYYIFHTIICLFYNLCSEIYVLEIWNDLAVLNSQNMKSIGDEMVVGKVLSLKLKLNMAQFGFVRFRVRFWIYHNLFIL